MEHSEHPEEMKPGVDAEGHGTVDETPTGEPPARPVRMKWGRPVEEDATDAQVDAQPLPEMPAPRTEEKPVPREDPRILALRARMEREAEEIRREAKRIPPETAEEQSSASEQQPSTELPQASAVQRKKEQSGKAPRKKETKKKIPSEKVPSEKERTVPSVEALPRRTTPSPSPLGNPEERRRAVEEETRLKEAENAAMRAELEREVLRKQLRKKRRREGIREGAAMLFGAIFSLFRGIRISKKAVISVLLTVFLSIVLATALGLFLGGRVESGESPDVPTSEPMTEESTESEPSGIQVPPLNAGIVSLKGATERTLKDAALRFASSGMKSVSLLLREEDGALLYASATDEVFGVEPEDSSLLTVEEILAPFQARGLYVSCLLPMRYYKDGNEYSEGILYAYETALLCEIAEAGADEIILLSADWVMAGNDDSQHTEDAVATLSEICFAVHRRAEKTAVGMALSPEFLATKESDRYLTEIADAFDFLLLDLRFAARSEKDQYEAVSEGVSEHLYFVLRYSMRVLIPEGCAEAVTRAEVYDWQEGSLSVTNESP